MVPVGSFPDSFRSEPCFGVQYGLVEELRPTLITLNSQPHLWKSAEERIAVLKKILLLLKCF
jgi:hypothetical protein